MWKRLRSRIAAAQGDLSGLERIDRCIRTRLGSEAPQYVHPLQKPEFYIPGLRARPWHDVAEFGWVARLERAHAAIAGEFAELQRAGALEARPEGRGGRWATCHLFFLGVKSSELCARCPETTRLVESIPGATSAGLVYFATLAPGTHLEPHCGPTNARLRCHLGLRVPEGCALRVGDEVRGWEEGRCVVFDDSFEHEVWHRGTEVRSVLVLDVWHPDLTHEETVAITSLMRMAASVSGRGAAAMA
jgi:aspartate beta-hydroxylase